MVKAMYAGVAGLKAHQSKMDVISNNIANVNTWGYKSMDTSFKESIYQTMTGGSAGSTLDGGIGGTNPSMVGYGAMVSTISSNFTTGTQVPTGQPLDMFIDGTGFFAVGPMYGEGESTSPSNLNLSRVGDFRVINNYLVDGNGRYVYGFSMAKGSSGYTPEATRTVDKTENVPIPNDKLPKDTDVTRNGVRTQTTYLPQTPNTGFMTVTKTVTESKSAAEVFKADGVKAPTSLTDLKNLIITENAKNPKIQYQLDPANDNNVIVSREETSDTAENVLGLAGNLVDTKDKVTAQVDLANKAATGNAAGNYYKVDPADPTGMKVIKTTKVSEVARTTDGSGNPTGLPGAVSGSTPTEIQGFIDRENLIPPIPGQDTIRYIIDPKDPTRVLRSKITVDDRKVIPLPASEIIDNGDGSTTTITYEDNKKGDGTATMITTTVTPPAKDAEFKGAPFDDGRMVFNPEDGTYKMAEGIDTLKPLKLPTTGIYYDKETGEPLEETDIQLGSFSIKPDGKIYGTSAATGNTYLLGSVALLSVSNPSGMTKADGPYYAPGGSSGSPKINEAGGSTGKLAAEFLESANVDIATEFSGMITTQRGFQANSKIITVTDEMLQELVNMKR